MNASFDARDSTSFTYAQVGEGAVRAAGSIGNRADSVALSGTNSQNGTRGLTTAPDLTGISVVSGSPQQIAFTFDQAVNPNAIVGTAGFHFVTSSGTPNCPIINAACDVASNTAAVSSTDPKTVIAQFPVGATPLVTNAVRGYIVPGAVSSATGEVDAGHVGQRSQLRELRRCHRRPDAALCQHDDDRWDHSGGRRRVHEFSRHVPGGRLHVQRGSLGEQHRRVAGDVLRVPLGWFV